MITSYQNAVLKAIAEHGPITFNEAAVATNSSWSDVNDVIGALKRSGHVLVFDDERVRLTAIGRAQAEGVRG